MTEPEALLLDGAQHATRFVQRLWRQSERGAGSRDDIQLQDVRARLELFVRAAFGQSLTIGVAEPPLVPPWFRRWGRRIPGHLVERRTLPSTDGTVLLLPRALPTTSELGDGLTTYRLYAAELATRARRGCLC